MKRIVAIMFAGVFFLVPATSWSKSESEIILERIAQLEALVASLQTQLASEVAARQAADTALSGSIITGDTNTLSSANTYTDAQIPASDSFLTNLKSYMTVDTTNHRITFGRPGAGVNIQLINGTGNTYSVNGKGNLVIGYDLKRGCCYNECSDGAYGDQPTCIGAGAEWAVSHKSGSHNIIIGDFNNYSQAGGFVAGWNNTINRESASVSGGAHNTASGDLSSVSGGWNNTASGDLSSVSGGESNTASRYYTSVSGGRQNAASMDFSSVSGGINNTASGLNSSLSGGSQNIASGENASISGGYENIASGIWSVVSGGTFNTASGRGASVSGGGNLTNEQGGNTASGENSVVSGGEQNTAGYRSSTVSGGVYQTTIYDGQHVP